MISLYLFPVSLHPNTPLDSICFLKKMSWHARCMEPTVALSWDSWEASLFSRWVRSAWPGWVRGAPPPLAGALRPLSAPRGVQWTAAAHFNLCLAQSSGRASPSFRLCEWAFSLQGTVLLPLQKGIQHGNRCKWENSCALVIELKFFPQRFPLDFAVLFRPKTQQRILTCVLNIARHATKPIYITFQGNTHWLTQEALQESNAVQERLFCCRSRIVEEKLSQVFPQLFGHQSQTKKPQDNNFFWTGDFLPFWPWGWLQQIESVSRSYIIHVKEPFALMGTQTCFPGATTTCWMLLPFSIWVTFLFLHDQGPSQICEFADFSLPGCQIWSMKLFRASF